MITVPAAQTGWRVPNGQEVITMVGGLELKTPPGPTTCTNILPSVEHGGPFRRACARPTRTLPTKSARRSQAACRNTSVWRGSRIAGRPAHRGRRFQHQPDYVPAHLAAAWAFFALDDKSAARRTSAALSGRRLRGFAGDVYCESRNENMDDHWRVLHALPGDGSSGRPALGT